MDFRKLKSKKGFTLIELMVVIVIIGILVAIALPNFISAQDRAKVSSVKSNAHTIQTMAETYAVDWGGVYAEKLSDGGDGKPGKSGLGLMVEAANKNYYKAFKNPFNSSLAYSDGTSQGSYMEAPTSENLETNSSGTTTAATAAGAVMYNVYGTGTAVTKYFIYGAGKENKTIIVDKGKAFLLTNQ